jgi:hypothetical protein
MAEKKLEPWQTLGPDGKVYGLEPVSDWTDWAFEPTDIPDIDDLSDEQLKRAAKKQKEMWG